MHPPESVQLVDGPYDSVPLELEELPPDDGIADSRCRLDDLLFVELVPSVVEEVMNDENVNQIRVAVLPDLTKGLDQFGLGSSVVCIRSPLVLEPLCDRLGLFSRLGGLYQAHRIAGSNAQTIGAECQGSQHRLRGSAIPVAKNKCSLRNRPPGGSNFGFLFEPFCQLIRQPARLKAVTRTAIGG